MGLFPKTSVECPTWCSEGHGHAYELRTIESEHPNQRHHSREFKAGGAEYTFAAVNAEAVSTEDAEIVGPAYIDIMVAGCPIDAPTEEERMTAAQARALAEALVMAADLLDTIEAQR